VAVLLCFGRVKSGPTGPFRSDSGAEVDGLLSRRDIEGRLSMDCGGAGSSAIVKVG
jgi:hypothetical protein